ncbi:branched-chain amino acid aminotransferase [Colletotrichum salicis]|uniref:Branched-chain amino acid aminotransferase n=1 Tax=Colletotrichum salicis TaxID=1209931 RepID=A0A135UMA9_9PEZI|nr:branched-chain amino acid aminotransferase [Colletotrichum salicis]
MLRVFRIEHNVARLRTSAARVSLPTFEPKEVKKLVFDLLSVEMLPAGSLENRLAVFFTFVPRSLVLRLSWEFKRQWKQCCSSFWPTCLASIYHRGVMRLYSSPKDAVRAWVGGFGYAKIGANYGPSVLVFQEASARGYHQVLWLYGEDGECTEAGRCNFFVVWVRKDGETELVIAPLDDKTILDGITRRSCLELARERLGEEIEVTERKFTVAEIMEAVAEDRLLESFAAGTAVSIPQLP